MDSSHSAAGGEAMTPQPQQRHGTGSTMSSTQDLAALPCCLNHSRESQAGGAGEGSFRISRKRNRIHKSRMAVLVERGSVSD